MADTVQDGKFQHSAGSECSLSLTNTHLEWTSVSEERTIDGSVLIGWVVNATKSFAPTPAKEHACTLSCILTISYIINDVTHEDGAHLKVAELVLCGAEEQCEKWVDKIKSCMIQAAPARPKNALVFLNPTSGSGYAQKEYKSRVAPVFLLAEINIDLHVTTKSDDSTGIIDTYDLDKIDSIIVVGGDGTHNSVLEALILRQMRENGLDINDLCMKIPTLKINMGFIPMGTGNVISLAAHCTSDSLTSALSILMGCTRMRDVYRVDSNSTFVGFSTTTLGYGLMAKMCKFLEQLRWMGTFRYKIAPLALFLGRPRFDVEIDILSNNRTSSKTDESPEESKPEWHNYAGTIMAAMLPLLEMHDLVISYPYNHVFNGECNKLHGLIITQPCSLLEHANYAKSLYKPKEHTEPEFPFISNYTNIHELRIRPKGPYAQTDAALCVDIDGELKYLPAPELNIRLQRNVFPMFVRSDLEDLCHKDSEKLTKVT